MQLSCSKLEPPETWSSKYCGFPEKQGKNIFVYYTFYINKDQRNPYFGFFKLKFIKNLMTELNAAVTKLRLSKPTNYESHLSYTNLQISHPKKYLTTSSFCRSERTAFVIFLEKSKVCIHLNTKHGNNDFVYLQMPTSFVQLLVFALFGSYGS